MKTIGYVLILGGLGSICRFGLSLIFPFFWGTLTVNLIGCFLLAFFFDFLSDHPKMTPDFIGGLTTGFLGSFTTFSTFSMENVQLFHQQEYFILFVYIFFSLIGGILAAMMGKSFASFRKKKVTG